MEYKFNSNPCPVEHCNGTTKEDETMIYCESCGFSIRKKIESEDTKTKSA